MPFVRVIGSQDDWKFLSNHFSNELQDLAEAMRVVRKGKSQLYKSPREEFTKYLKEKDWYYREKTDRNLLYRGGLVVRIATGTDKILQMVFDSSLKVEFEKVAFTIIPTITGGTSPHMRLLFANFNSVLSLIKNIIPPSFGTPLLILGYSDAIAIENMQLFEWPTYKADAKISIDRSIEFPPEYHQAGLSILNYFGTFLREQYPDQQAKVRIEQDGLVVRLKVETNDGRSEIVERALHEYQMIVRGEASPEQFTSNSALIIGLKNKLEIAAMEIRLQQNIIGLQNDNIHTLLSIVGNALASGSTINFKPNINVTTNLSVAHVSHALGTINELKDIFASSSEMSSRLTDLEKSLEKIEKEKDPEVVKQSGAMSKFKRVVESFAEGTTETQKAIKAVEGGWDIVKDLADKYNRIAEWCGLPQVPRIFAK